MRTFAAVALLVLVVCVGLGQEVIPAPKTRLDEGKLAAENKKGKPLHWQWYLETKDYRWLLGMPDDGKTGKSTGVAEVAQKLEGKHVVVTSRAGHFGLGKQKSLLVLKIEPKQK